MVYNSPRSPPSIFQGGRIKPGVYKIQNIVSKTYVDIKDDVRELCGRPSQVLEYGRDQWDIQPLGSGYTIRKVGNSTSVQPDQYCTMLNGLGNGTVVSVSDLPVAWKIQAVEDDRYHGFEYVRIFWGSTNKVWDLAGWGSDRDRTKIDLMENSRLEACRIWEFIRVETPAGRPAPSYVPQRDASAPPYEENTADTCTCSHLTTEPSDDGFGTTVIEVTTVTTRRRIRLDD